MATPEEINQALEAILGMESSRNYGVVGPTHPRYGRALGGFQVMEANLRPWLRDAGMSDMSPEEFLANPDAQRNLFRHRFGQYASRHGLEGASRAWFAGEGGMNDPNRSDVFGTSVAEYARRFNARLGGRNVPGPGNTGDQTIDTTVVNTPDVRNSPERPENWSQWLSNPANRAFLMSAGAQMAQPTWGNAASQFASGLAAGGQAQADTGNRVSEEERRRLELQSGEVQGELNRRSMERRTTVASESRLDVAGLRANAMLERARMIGLRQPGQQNEYMRTVRSLYSTLLQNNPSAMTSPEQQERLFNQAMEQAEATFRRQLNLQGQNTQNPPVTNQPPVPPGGPNTLNEPANQPTPNVQAPPAPSSPLTQNPMVDPRAYRPNQTPSTADSRPPWEQWMARPRAQEVLRNPELRRLLLINRPEFRQQIEQWLRDNQGVR